MLSDKSTQNKTLLGDSTQHYFKLSYQPLFHITGSGPKNAGTPWQKVVFRKKTFSVKYGPPEALNIITILLNDIEEKTRHYLQSYYRKVVVTNQSYPKTNNQKSLFSFLSHQ